MTHKFANVGKGALGLFQAGDVEATGGGHGGGAAAGRWCSYSPDRPADAPVVSAGGLPPAAAR